MIVYGTRRALPRVSGLSNVRFHGAEYGVGSQGMAIDLGTEHTVIEAVELEPEGGGEIYSEDTRTAMIS